jgi:hypothetical protein
MENILAKHLRSRRVKSLSLREHNWCGIEIEGGYGLSNQTWCRFVGTTGSFVSTQDHGQKFGLPKPYDAEAALGKELIGKVINDVTVREFTNDVILHFDHGCLEILTSSSGYESSQLNGPDNLIVVMRAGE